MASRRLFLLYINVFYYIIAITMLLFVLDSNFAYHVVSPYGGHCLRFFDVYLTYFEMTLGIIVVVESTFCPLVTSPSGLRTFTCMRIVDIPKIRIFLIIRRRTEFR